MTRKVVIVGGRPDMAAAAVAAVAAINAGGEILAIGAPPRADVSIPIPSLAPSFAWFGECEFQLSNNCRSHVIERLDIPIAIGRREFSGTVTTKPLPPSTDTRQQRRYRARKGIR